MLQAAESRGFSNCLSVALNHNMLDSIFYSSTHFFFFFFFAIAELLDMQPEKKEEVKEAL